MITLGSIVSEVMDEIEKKSRKTIYQNDYLAWASDVLGRRYYATMAEIMENVAHAPNGKTRTAVKSANGCGKSFALSDVGTWWITAFPPEESLAIFTANGRDQIERVVFKYLKDNYGYMNTNGFKPIGKINESLEWKYFKPDGSGNEAIAFGKRPADQDIVSSFQGTRKRRTFVGLDEMGGLPEDLITAAEAVTTGDETRMFGIGNPDRRATPFHNLFTQKKYADDWNLYTISAYDLPTVTGEQVYPDEERQTLMLTSGLTTKRWIEHKERAWRTEEANGDMKPNALFKAKVLGEFPEEDDSTYFPESDITRAIENEIDPSGTRGYGGFDPGFQGEDESVFFVNKGGHCRVFEGEISYYDDAGEVIGKTSGVWGKATSVDNARRAHAIAQYLGLEELRVDASGAGVGVFNELDELREFRDKEYKLVGIRGGTSSTDRNQWAKARDEQHSDLKKLLHDRKIDLDPSDTKTKDELMIVTYEMNERGAVKITPKKKLRTEFGGSPNRLDALIYATANTSKYIDQVPDKARVGFDPFEMLQMEQEAWSPGVPG